MDKYGMMTMMMIMITMMMIMMVVVVVVVVVFILSQGVAVNCKEKSKGAVVGE